MPIYSSSMTALNAPKSSYQFFEHSTGNIKVPTTADLVWGTGSISGSVWFRAYDMEDSQTASYIMTHLDSSGATSRGFILYYYKYSHASKGRVGIQFYRGSGSPIGYDIFSNARYNDNRWHHVAFVIRRDGSTSSLADMSLYIDGILAPTYSSMNNPENAISGFAPEYISNSVDLKFGDGISSWGPFQGEISNARLFNFPLSSDEVSDLYTSNTVPHKYVGASQSDIITPSANFTNGVYNGWTKYDGGGNSEGSNWGTLGATNGYAPPNDPRFSGSGHYWSQSIDTGSVHSGDPGISKQNITVERGKAYEFSLWHRFVESSPQVGHGTYGYIKRDMEGASTTDETFGVGTGWNKHVHRFTATTNSVSIYLRLTTAGHYLIFAPTLRQIGCIGEWTENNIRQEELTSTDKPMWIDTSGNQLHGLKQYSSSTSKSHMHAMATNEQRMSAITVNNVHTSAMNFGGTTTGQELDAYEEGTWSPEFRAFTTNVHSTYVFNTEGTYTRVGNRCYVTWCMKFNNNAITSTYQWQYIRIYGLPYYSDHYPGSATEYRSPMPILTNNFNWVYSTDLYGRVQNNYITPYFTNINSGSLNYEAYPYYLMGSEASGGRSMQGSGWYKIKE